MAKKAARKPSAKSLKNLKPSKPLASYADKHDLYQRAVQCVEAEIDFVDRIFRRLRGGEAKLLREDFCGTCNSSSEWARRRPGNIAVGLDLDAPTLDWGLRHNIARLKPEQRERVIQKQMNVLDGASALPEGFGCFDVVLAMNFSYWCFHERAMLLRYFKGVHESISGTRRTRGGGGLFFLDFYGGPDAFGEQLESKRVPGRTGGGTGSAPFRYLWHQHRHNPINNGIECFIHFTFDDGSELRKAFHYDWRIWTVAEIRDVLSDAGFSKSTVYWEGDDKKGGGNGIFRPATRAKACPSYIGYIVAEP